MVQRMPRGMRARLQVERQVMTRVRLRPKEHQQAVRVREGLPFPVWVGCLDGALGSPAAGGSM